MSLETLPLILAGPILRHVDARSVTVWVALKSDRSVLLRVTDLVTNQEVLAGARATVTLGKGLHVVAVTAEPPNGSSTLLKPDHAYAYDLVFDSGLATEQGLLDHGVFTSDGYESLVGLNHTHVRGLPSFELAPNSSEDLRVAHASCRKPHGPGRDAYEALDELTPHQLFLTGDQIYADDVADAVLHRIHQIHGWLFGKTRESLPGIDSTFEPLNYDPGKNFGPGRRFKVLEACSGFLQLEADSCKSHVVTLSEYLTLYLLAWSDVLWPRLLPSAETVQPLDDEVFDDEIRDLKEFRRVLPRVRRVLANVPTYMMFDDHEITDDWNLNRDWCESVAKKPLGRRILRNGLAAFAVCQAWGNTPDRFLKGTTGGQFLDALEGWMTTADAGKQPNEDKTLEAVAGMSEIGSGEERGRLVRASEADSLRWHFSYTFPSHRLVVLDTRTRRGFPNDDPRGFPALLAAEEIEPGGQIPDAAPGDPALTLVVSPAPVLGHWLIELVQSGLPGLYKVLRFLAAVYRRSLPGLIHRLLTGPYKPDDPRITLDTEAWSLEEGAYRRLLDRLAACGPSGGGSGAGASKPHRVVVFSGDVHYGFAARAHYRLRHPQSAAPPTEMVMVQLTSSGGKNEIDKWPMRLLILNRGPLHPITLPILLELTWSDAEVEENDVVCRRDLQPEVKKALSGLALRTLGPGVGALGAVLPWVLGPDDWRFRSSDPTLHLAQWLWELKELPAEPVRAVRTEYLEDDLWDNGRRRPQTVVTLPFQGDPPHQLAVEIEASSTVSKLRAELDRERRVVRPNNTGHVVFQTGDEAVVQDLWWHLEDDDEANGFVLSRFTSYRAPFAFPADFPAKTGP